MLRAWTIVPSRTILTTWLALAAVPCHPAVAGEGNVIAICWGRPGRLECGAAATESLALMYSRRFCRYWSDGKAEADQCRELWRCALSGWAAVARSDARFVVGTCGRRTEREARDQLKDRCSECSIETLKIGSPIDPSPQPSTATTAGSNRHKGAESSEAGTRMFLAATARDGTRYGAKNAGGLQCSDLIIDAAREAGLNIRVPAQGKATVGWFADGMGPDFRQVLGGAEGVSLAELRDLLASPSVSLPVGSVVVAEGHAAFYAGFASVGGEREIIFYDANATKADYDLGVTSGRIEKTGPAGPKEMGFKGASVGYHLSRFYMQLFHKVKVFAPVR